MEAIAIIVLLLSLLGMGSWIYSIIKDRKDKAKQRKNTYDYLKANNYLVGTFEEYMKK